MLDAVDVLMITHNRSYYTRKTLPGLLNTCDDKTRVWVWQNGNDPETLSVVEQYKSHPNFHRFFHSPQNEMLNTPTNWLWENSDAVYLAKVDDDCLVPNGWIEQLRKAHCDVPSLGVVACWHFPEEDVDLNLATKKIKRYSGGHQIMRNCWVGGSGYLMKRECYSKLGSLKGKQTFTGYCIQLAKRGYIIGWYYPFIYQEHLDDPRCPDSLLKNDNDMQKWAPLSAINNGVTTIEAWQVQLKRSAQYLQKASYNPKYYLGWYALFKKGRMKLKKCVR